jgi:NTP pyrophosphatase (non-canonical NTP hydrolase)
MNISEEKDIRGIHTVHLTPLSEDVFKANKAKGFWGGERNKGELLMLVTSELAEALEADRKNSYANASLLNSLFKVEDNERFKEDFERLVKDTFEDEIADAVIRLLDLCGGLGIDLSKHVELKLRYNSLRGEKHGKLY